MEWTRALRYKKFDQWSDTDKKKLLDQVAHSPWRLSYHVQPESGLLNDPNGFCYFNNQWHLFYQWYPMGPVHGLKCWYHVTSNDLIHWQNEGPALLPGNPYDSHGCYSGSALPVGDRLFMMYTGNVRDENWQRSAYQLGAWMDIDNQIEKIKEPLIASVDQPCTEHFRDPQIISIDKMYYALIGAQNKQLQGQIYVYTSPDLQHWTFIGPLSISDAPFGYMIECPNLAFVDDKPVLIFCPQGASKDLLAYDNIYPNAYITADAFQPSDPRLVNPSRPANLDDGFDFYAAQAFNAPDGRTLMIGWVGLPEIDYPTDRYGWAHCLSLVRELTWADDGRLCQNPVQETETLRGARQLGNGQLLQSAARLLTASDASYEFIIRLSGDSRTRLSLCSDGHQSLDLVIDFHAGLLVLDRTRAGIAFAESYGTTRTVQLQPEQPVELRIFIDQSVAEIYINHGRSVMTARFFPSDAQRSIDLETAGHLDYTYEYWQLQTSKG